VTNLDRDDTYTAIDQDNMRDLIARLPEQSRRAWELGQDWAIPQGFSRPGRVVIFGMGGSAAGADVVASLAESTSTVPVDVFRGYSCPEIADDTLAVACSFSGETEETLSAFGEAFGRAGMHLAIGTGGTLLRETEDRGCPVFSYDWEGPPRTAFGYGLFPLLAILQRLDVIPIETREVESAIDELSAAASAWVPSVAKAHNTAKQIASRLVDRLPVVLGAGALSVSASRWAAQINENAKQWSFAAALPEANHNLIVGFGAPDWLRDRVHVVILEAAAVDERDRLRVRLTAEMLADANVSHEVVDLGGGGKLGAMMLASHLSDWVSYYLALLRQVDPTPVPQIESLKSRLGQAAS
jgi:glucose/mannose-6-phosphate isomerase